MRRHNCLEAINSAMLQQWPTMAHVNLSDIRHFMYKSRSIAQFIEPAFDIPYATGSSVSNMASPGVSQGQSASSLSPDLERISSMYFRMHSRLHSHSRPLKLIYWVSDYENWIGWVSFTMNNQNCALHEVISK